MTTVKYFNFSQALITALVELKLIDLCNAKGLDVLIAPTSLLGSGNYSYEFFDNFSTSKYWRDYFVTSLLIRIPASHSKSGSMIKIYFMTRNKVQDNSIVEPSGFIIAVKDASEPQGTPAIREGYYHYDADFLSVGISGAGAFPFNASTSNFDFSQTNPILETLTDMISSVVFTTIKKYYI